MEEKIECMELEEVERVFETDFKKGLSEEEAEKRLLRYGKNELVEKKRKSWIRIFLGELNNPMIYVLFIAILITIMISIYETVKCIKEGNSFSFTNTGDWPDVIIIMIVILLNALIGTVQEIKAYNSLEALKKMSALKSMVIRDGKKQRIDSNLLTIGDIVVIDDGDNIGADLRLIETCNLKVNESSLTGESMPTLKNANMILGDKTGIGDRLNCAYMSTNVSYGRGIGVVCNVGMNTEIGKIASSISSSDEPKTNLEKILMKLSKFLGLLTLLIVIVVLAIDIMWILIDGHGSNIEYYIEAMLSSISLAVAAIPEGLSAVITIVLALGVLRMVKVNTIVSKLQSVETLGSVSVICSDKTGTLTLNKMTVVKCYVNNKLYDEEAFINYKGELSELVIGLCLCSNASIDGGLFGDPTEIALVELANTLGFRKVLLEDKYPRVDELPFDSNRKMMSTLHKKNNEHILYTKGALDSILKYTKKINDGNTVRDITENDINKILEVNSKYSKEALRVLALAYKESDKVEETDLVFLGLVAMIDPPRREAHDAVLELKDAGITTVMITGDHKDTAFAVAKKLEICNSEDECLTGSDIDSMSQEELMEACKSVGVFSRVSPENKVQIVRAFQGLGNICAMTGDGVNDAPSLKAADIGIAMGITGTDVSKDASDMILADDNFASIKSAVCEGRKIYNNIRKTVYFLLGSNMAEVFTMLLLIIIGLPAPLIAIHLLWVNLITDSLPAIALGVEPQDESIMKEHPRAKDEGIFAHGGLFYTIGYGLVVTIGVIISYFACAWLNGVYSLSAIKDLYSNNSNILHQAQTMAFTTLAFSELFHMLGMSNTKRSIVFIFKNKNIMLFIAFVLGIILQVFVIKVPGISDVFQTYNISGIEWVIVLVLSILPILVHEIVVVIKKIKK
ncbi:MAG: cation-translocating P-type ATPase [Anaeroplasmataceae bacterium]